MPDINYAAPTDTTPSAAVGMAVLDHWEARTRAVERAHFERCRKFRHYHLCLGGAAVTISTLSALTTLDSESFKSMLGEQEAFLGAILAIFSPVLTSLVSFLRFEERSSQHHNAAARFSSLKRRLQLLLFECTTVCDRAKASTTFDEVRKEWDALTLQAPALYKSDWSEIHDLDLKNAAARQSATGPHVSSDGTANHWTRDLPRVRTT